MAALLLGGATALPPFIMSQADALRMSTEIISENERQARLLRALFRKSSVQARRTVVPYQIAYQWCAMEPEAELARAAAAAIASSSSSVEATGGNNTASLTVQFLEEAQVDTEIRSEQRGPTTQQRMQLYARHAPPLAIDAAQRALDDAGLDPQRITHLVTVSCTGFDAPGIDITLMQTLPLDLQTQRLHIGFMGCHGAINGMRAAEAIVASQPDACVLLVAVEACSLHYRFSWDDESMVGNALFADGAAAWVLAARPPADRPTRGTEAAPKARQWKVRATGSCLIPHSTDTMSWRVGDFGFEMRLTSEVGERIEATLADWLVPWLGRYGESLESIQSWLVHPGGPKILQAVQASLGLDESHTAISREVLAEHGNMSSPTVLFIHDRIRDTAVPGAALMLGFGPGLVAEAALLECAVEA